MKDPIRETIDKLQRIDDFDENRLEKINALMKTIDTISSETIYFHVDNDPFTKWDCQYVHVVKYIDGRVTREPSEKRMPSIRLHKINSIMESWGFKMARVRGHWDDIFVYESQDEKNIPSFSIEMNPFHTHLFTIQGVDRSSGTYNYTYDDSTVDSFINLRVEEFLEKHGSVKLLREVKLRRILN